MDEALLKSGQFPNVAILAGCDPKEVMREYGQTDTEHTDSGVCVHMCPYDSRELLEADVRSEYYGGIESEADEIIGWLDRQAAITRRECADERENLLIEAIATCTKKISKLEAERDALKEQINRFNASKSEENAENGASKGVLNNIDVQNDTREQLEADVHQYANPSSCKNTLGASWEKKMLSFLDRQAAITERECHASSTWALQERYKALNRVAELTAERDEFSLKLKYEMELNRDNRNAFDLERIDELTAERDHFRKHVNHLMALIADIARKQPYTFDPEAPYMTLDTIGDYLDELHGDVASMRAERDELQAKVDELTAESNEFADELKLDAIALDELRKQVDELTAERDQLSRDLEAEHALVVQFEYDNAKANDTINTLRASVAGLKETVEKLGAK